MALTCTQILVGAARKLGVLAIGRSLTAPQGESGMEMLQSLYLELVGQGVFGRMIDTLVTDSSYDAHENERVICDRTVTTVVNLPSEISAEWIPNQGYIGGPFDYGWSNSASSTWPRAPHDNAIIQIADQNNADNGETHVYDAPRASWVEITALALNSTAPLSERYGEALKALMAEKWAPDFNVAPPPTLAAQVATAKSLLSHRYDRNARAAVGCYF